MNLKSSWFALPYPILRVVMEELPGGPTTGHASWSGPKDEDSQAKIGTLRRRTDEIDPADSVHCRP